MTCFLVRNNVLWRRIGENAGGEGAGEGEKGQRFDRAALRNE